MNFVTMCTYMDLYTLLKAASIWKGWGRQKAEQFPSDCRQIVYTEYFFSKWSSFITMQPSRITLRFTHTIVSPGVGIVASFFGASIIRWDMDIIIISIIIVILLFTCQGYRCKNPNCDVDVHEWCREVWSFFPQFSQFLCSSVLLPVAWTLQKWSK